MATGTKVGLYTLGAGQTASKPASFDYFHLSTAVVDTTAPVATSTVDGPLSGGWYTGPVTVTLAGDRQRRWLRRRQGRVPGGRLTSTWTVYSAPVPLSGDGTHTVKRYRATDKAGNVSSCPRPPP